MKFITLATVAMTAYAQKFNLDGCKVQGVSQNDGDIWYSTGDKWTEFSDGNKHSWEKYGCDRHSMYLKAPAGTFGPRSAYQAQIDLYLGKVFFYRYNGAPREELGDIKSAF